MQVEYCLLYKFRSSGKKDQTNQSVIHFDLHEKFTHQFNRAGSPEVKYVSKLFEHAFEIHHYNRCKHSLGTWRGQAIVLINMHAFQYTFIKESNLRISNTSKKTHQGRLVICMHFFSFKKKIRV